MKYGFRVVEAWPNWQLLCYALAIAAHYNEDYRKLIFIFTIYQPRAYHRDGPARSIVVPGSDLVPYVVKLKEAIENALSKTPTLQPGPQCKHCPGRATCKALRSEVASGVYVDSHGLPFEDAERELQYLEKQKVLLDGYITGLRAQVEHGLRSGKPSRFYELRSTAGRLAWDEGAAPAVLRMARLAGVKVTKEPQLITPTQALPLLGEIVNMYARRHAGSVEMAPVDASAILRKFKQ